MAWAGSAGSAPSPAIGGGNRPRPPAALLRRLLAARPHGVALGVDADSLTGATGLYESVGMRVVQQYDQFRKLIAYSSTE